MDRKGENQSVKNTANANLHNAKTAKKDEFYTQLSDIENELFHYKEHFKDKIVYCNCDDPLESKFFQYFFLNFKFLDLKALISTCYKSQNFKHPSSEDSPTEAYAIKICKNDKIKGELFNPNNSQHTMEDLEKVLSTMHPLSSVEQSLSISLSCGETQSKETIQAFEANKQRLKLFKAQLESDPPKDSTPCLLFVYEDVEEGKGLGNAGDFRSKDCIELLKLADIVVTNPPFSLFREYVAQLVEYDKKFVIVGNIHAITYKEIFPYLKNNQIWIGYTKPKEFIDAKNKTTQKFGNIYWYSNLNIKKRSEILETIASYKKNPEKYPKYDNYDAIDVKSVMEIPLDYNGAMGVPSAFLEKYNPKQFQLLGIGTGNAAKELGVAKNYRGRTDLSINSKCPYARILIRKIAEVEDLHKAEQEARKTRK